MESTIDVKLFGAVGDGINDDTDSIKKAIADMRNNSMLYFKSGIYRVTDELIINGLLNITIKGDGAGTSRILNDSVGKSIVIKDSSYIDINDIGFIGNGTAPSGKSATNGDGLVFINTSHVMFSGCDISFHGGNGINLVAGCWVFNFINVRAIGNQGNGFSGITKDSLQSTAVYFSNCVFWYNKLSGIHWCAVGLTIIGSIFEKNKIGVWLDCTNSNHHATNVVITGSDFEINEFEQIKLTTYKEKSGLSIKIDGNNFVNTEENKGKSDGLIVIDGDGTNVIGLDLGTNNYSFLEYHNAFNGNNKLYEDCKIHINRITPPSKFVNIGQAKISGLDKTKVINGFIEQKGIPYSNPNISDDLLSLPNRLLGYWKLPFKNGGFIKSVSMNVETDANTDYKVLFVLNVQKEDGQFIDVASGEITKKMGGSGTVTFPLGISFDHTSSLIVLLKTEIIKPSTGTILKVKNLVVEGSF